MGADLCLYRLVWPKSQKLKWAPARKMVIKFDFSETDTDCNDVLKDLDDLRKRFDTDDYRDCDSMVVGGYNVFVTGGLSWGDDPSTSAGIISRLCEEDIGFDVLGVIGFLVPDEYRKPIRPKRK